MDNTGQRVLAIIEQNKASTLPLLIYKSVDVFAQNAFVDLLRHVEVEKEIAFSFGFK